MNSLSIPIWLIMWVKCSIWLVYLTPRWSSKVMRSIITVNDHTYMQVAWWYKHKGQWVSDLPQTCLPLLKDHHCCFLSFSSSLTPPMDSQRPCLRSQRTSRFLLVFVYRCIALLRKWFSKVTTNISSSNFVGFTKKSLKADSILDCASRCVYWEQKSSYCNAFRYLKQTESLSWKLPTPVCNFWHCLLNWEIFLKAPKRSSIS